MKSILISIQPKWCELIASGKKTVEVRKTRPNIETPFKCYIYCTLSGSVEFFKYMEDTLGQHEALSKWNREKWGNRKGKVIGEFVCDFFDEFTIDIGVRFKRFRALYETALSVNEMKDYLGNKGKGYGWHISNLKIYDKPKELGKFRYPPFKKCKLKFDKKRCENGCVNNSLDCSYRKVLRPPQSYCFVEEL